MFTASSKKAFTNNLNSSNKTLNITLPIQFPSLKKAESRNTVQEINICFKMFYKN